MDELRKAWAAYQAELAKKTPDEPVDPWMALAKLVEAVGKLLEEDPPANFQEVYKRYGIDPKMRPPGGGVPLWLCLANKWRDDMHAFLELEDVMKADLEEVKTNQCVHDTRPEDQDEL
jgi:hypothetical protein